MIRLPAKVKNECLSLKKKSLRYRGVTAEEYRGIGITTLSVFVYTICR